MSRNCIKSISFFFAKIISTPRFKQINNTRFQKIYQYIGLLPQLTTSTSFYLVLQMLLFQIPPVLPKVRNPGSSLLPEMLLAKSSILAQVPAKLPRNVLLLLPDVDTCPQK